MVKFNKSLNFKYKILAVLGLFFSSFFYSQTDIPPSITAQGKQAFCVGTSIKIVTDFTITDPDDTGLDSFFIQISSGYQANLDRLNLSGSHPNIIQIWNPIEGKLTLISSASNSEMLFTDLENAVKDVTFTTSANTITTEKSFSLSIGDANYLPATDHFYQFIANQGITWSTAKTAAENSTYFGRQGYLATLTSQEEADFAGKQVSGAGWIGGSDAETEGQWKWVTGPEAGIVFWNGEVSGTTPNYANWNNNEPNDFKGNNPVGEDYAHITDPSIGIQGAWNDLPNEGGTGLYIAKGYVVEYGAPGDAPLNIVASTSIYIPQILNITEAVVCQSGVATISATPSEGTILWFDAQTTGTLVATGNNFTTPVLTNNTTYFATVSVNGCTTLDRTPVIITVNQRPIITGITEDLICEGTATLSATVSAGNIYWFDSLTSTTPLFIGNSFETPVLNTTTSYFIEANNNNCISSTRTEVTATVNTLIPDFDVENDTVVLCNDVGTIQLKVINPQANYTYVWKKEGVIIPGELLENSVSEPGNYSVVAFSNASCQSVEKSILVRNSEIAIITKEDLVIIDDSSNNSITVALSNLGIGDYEFSLDDEFGRYKELGFFENISTGIHTLYIRDKGGCGIAAYSFSILEYPKFFTPNNDGRNDLWHIKGYNKNFYTVSDIYIYNRFGAFIYKIDAASLGWNGTYQGKLLPSSTYWFQTILTDQNGLSIVKKGSISLIRK